MLDLTPLRVRVRAHAVTVNDGIPGNGTWDDLVKFVKNGVPQGLFGYGANGYGASSMISNVYIGGAAPWNPYTGMNQVLGKLGIKSEPMTIHFNHFHIDIAAPNIIPLPNNLLAESTPAADYAAAAQTIAAEVQSSFGFDQGDLTMLFMDMPNTPPQYTPVIVAQATQATKPNTERTIGVCHPVENRVESRLSAVNAFSPVLSALAYLDSFEHKKIDQQADFLSIFGAAKMTLLQTPKQGELKLGQNSGAYYSSDYNYEGTDSATVLVEVAGYKVTVIYHFVLMKNVPGSSDQGSATDNKKICPNGYQWKISTTPDANGNITVNSVEYLAPAANAAVTDIAASASTLGTSVLGSLTGEATGVTAQHTARGQV